MISYLTNLMVKEKKLAVGLMSGTSIDGIDAALVEIEGNGENSKIRLIEFDTYFYTEQERKIFKHYAAQHLIC